MSHQNLRIDKADMDRIKKERGIEEGEQEKKKVPAKKVVLWTVMCLIGIAYIVIMGFGRYFLPKGNEFYQSFDIFSKTNPVGYARLLSYALLVVIAGSLLRAIFQFLRSSDRLTKRMGKAVLDLFSNLVKYVMFIILICLLLNAFGVNATAILAGLGIITLIIGLGVTSLIEDIVAGFFIIAERLFDVGDIVVLDGFRGTVVSIGIRSTKIADIGNSILTVRNSSIGSLINLTDRDSCAAVTFPLAPGESIQKVEAVMQAAQLEKLGETNDKVLMGPLYLGTCGINKWGSQELLFIAGCKEENIYDVERFIYREVAIIFEKNGIKIGAEAKEE
jgi:small conductance mechanosensitive channel